MQEPFCYKYEQRNCEHTQYRDNYRSVSVPEVEGKEAHRVLLGGDAVTDKRLNAVIERLEYDAVRLLGMSFCLAAKRSRTIAGWHSLKGNRVRLGSGLTGREQTGLQGSIRWLRLGVSSRPTASTAKQSSHR